MYQEHLDRLESGLLEIAGDVKLTRTMYPMWEQASILQQLVDVEKQCGLLIADVLALKTMLHVPSALKEQDGGVRIPPGHSVSSALDRKV